MSETIAGYQIHPAASVFPLMPSAELAELAADIGRHGLREPVVVHDGLVLDGRNRLKACAVAGVKPHTVEWDQTGSALDYVVSINVRRRHLSAGQKAMIAQDLLPLYEAEAKERKIEGNRAGGIASSASTDDKLTQREKREKRAAYVAAAAVGASGCNVERAKVVVRDAPQLAEKVRSGEMTLRSAHLEASGASKHDAASKPLKASRRGDAVAKLKHAVSLMKGRGALDIPFVEIEQCLHQAIKLLEGS